MADQPDSLRAADVDREFVAEKLRGALNEGRLTLSEYDDRVRDAYAARTYGDLKGLLADLPDVTPAARSALTPRPTVMPPAAPAVASAGHAGRWLAGIWSSWLTVSLVITAIWFATSVGNHHPDNFWPIWVIVPWGAILLASTITGVASGAPRREAEKRARRDAEREARREAERNRSDEHDAEPSDDS